jgi:hypothetical protein
MFSVVVVFSASIILSSPVSATLSLDVSSGTTGSKRSFNVFGATFFRTFSRDVFSNFAGLGRLEGSGSTQRSMTFKLYRQS